MINICIFFAGGRIKGFEYSGHAGYAEKGSDIVCAAVSILGYSCLNTLKEKAEIAADKIKYEQDEKSGYMKVITLECNEKTDVVFGFLEVGIKLLLQDYNKYVSLDYKEV